LLPLSGLVGRGNALQKIQALLGPCAAFFLRLESARGQGHAAKKH
jgi:hypothetical protein